MNAPNHPVELMGVFKSGHTRTLRFGEIAAGVAMRGSLYVPPPGEGQLRVDSSASVAGLLRPMGFWGRVLKMLPSGWSRRPIFPFHQVNEPDENAHRQSCGGIGAPL